MYVCTIVGKKNYAIPFHSLCYSICYPRRPVPYNPVPFHPVQSIAELVYIQDTRYKYNKLAMITPLHSTYTRRQPVQDTNTNKNTIFTHTHTHTPATNTSTNTSINANKNTGTNKDENKSYSTMVYRY